MTSSHPTSANSTSKKSTTKKPDNVASVVIELRSPVVLGGIDMSTLTIRRPKVRDMLAIENMKGSDVEKELTLFANLCEVTPECLQDLDMADYGLLQKTYQDFLS